LLEKNKVDFYSRMEKFLAKHLKWTKKGLITQPFFSNEDSRVSLEVFTALR
jgi:hypothetical protein